MSDYGKSQAIGYSDYYNNNTNTPDSTDNSTVADTNVDDVKKRREAALKRRLRKLKVSS
jgi:hypothetical protein